MKKTSFFKNLMAPIVKYFSGTPNDVETKLHEHIQGQDNVNENERQQKINSLNTSINEFFLNNSLNLSIDDNTLIISLSEFLNVSANKYERLGHVDGVLGSKDYDIKIRAISHATYIQETVFSSIKSKIDGIEQAILSIDELLHRSLKKLSISDTFHNSMLELANNNNKDFSNLRMWMYNIVGFILLIADIPLSVNIVGTLGLVKMPDDSSSDPMILNNNTDESLDELSIITSIWQWFTDYWEVILFSFGIALSTVIIKILYDEYIYTKLGKWSKELESFNSDQRRGVVVERFIKLTVNLLILFGLFFMLFNLGEIRNETVFLKSGKSDIRNTSFWSFVLITLIMPTISGVCLSIGFTISDNIKAFNRSKLQLKENEILISEIVNDRTILVMKRSQLEVFFEEWMNSKHKIDFIAQRFSSSYNQGFKRGYLIEHGHDIYKLVEGLHAESINKVFKMN